MTWSAQSLALPLLHGDEQDPRVALLVNPGMEVVALKARGGAWVVDPGGAFPGLVTPGPDLKLGHPVPGIAAHVTSDSLTVAVGLGAMMYDAGADERILAIAREKRGILLLVTHALGPSEVTGEGLDKTFRSGNLLAGWVGLRAR